MEILQADDERSPPRHRLYENANRLKQTVAVRLSVDGRTLGPFDVVELKQRR
jgi:hypothetical protein